MIRMTAEGLARQKEHLLRLEARLRELVQGKGEAAVTGGNAWHDNFSFEQIEREERMLRAHLAQLRWTLDRSEVVVPPADPTEVEIGVSAEVLFEGEPDPEVLQLVGAGDSDPCAGRISDECPMGQALLGTRPGDERVYFGPDGALHRFTVRKIWTESE